MGVKVFQENSCLSSLENCTVGSLLNGTGTGYTTLPPERKEEKLVYHCTAERKSSSESPWKNQFRNPSQLRYSLHSRANLGSQDSCPWRVQEELERRDLQASAEEKDGELCVEEEPKTNRVHYAAGQKKEAVSVTTENRVDFQEDVSEPVAYVASLKACAKQKDLRRGRQLHSDILKRKLQNNLFVGTTLVYMYAKCGALVEAQEAFDGLPVRDVASWNALISGYTQHGQGKRALECFEKMQRESISPNALTFSCILKACGSIKAAERGCIVHELISRAHLLEQNIVVGNALVDMYAKCGLLEKAQDVFDELLDRNVVTWNTLIAAYAEHGHGEDAIHCFEEMQLQGLSPDAVTFVCILKACGGIKASDKGEEVHAHIARDGLLEYDTVVGTALVDMYAKCGLLEKAQDAFDKLSVHDVAAWNALVAGYAQHSHGEEALNCFEQMQRHGLSPDAATFACILKACGITGATEKGQKLHAYIVREGLLEKNIVVANALVDMYVKCGLLEKAQEEFNKLSVQDIVSWNVLVAGYTQHCHEKEALNCFEQMQLRGFCPDEITFSCILKACSSVGAAHKGQEIHDNIVREGFLGKTMIVGNALVDTYTSCGMIAEAQEMFNKLAVRDVISWNTLMTGYAQLGKSDAVFNLFNKMVDEALEPDMITFTVVLNACSHGGLLDQGQAFFEIISTGFGIIPTLEHHTCMIDLFGRAGLLDKAVAVTKEMPLSADFTVSQSILAAYRNWRDFRYF